MNRVRVLVVGCLVVGLLSIPAVEAQELGPESFATGFEAEAGYVADTPVPGQPGDYPEMWFSWYGDDPNNPPTWDAEIRSAAVAHSGSQCAVFPLGFTDLQHVAMLDSDPNRYPPLEWEEAFSVFVSSSRKNSWSPALRSEPWNGWEGSKYAYQLFLWHVDADDGLATSFDEYALDALPGQFDWYSWYGEDKATISTAMPHGGPQAIAFPENFTDIQRAVMNGDPTLPPVTWEEKYWIYVPGALADGTEVLRGEPWNNWAGTGYSYQFWIYRVDDGLTNGWRPVLGWGALENDLRDEMGMDPLFDSFATDTWWNVTVVADGAIGRVLSVTISDGAGGVYEATELSEPFSTWGNDLTDNDPPGETYAYRPERVLYYSEGGGVYFDDFSLTELGAAPTKGWWPELGWEVNDLRDELGMAPDELFAPDKWWNITIVADGLNGVVDSVSISDDFGTSYAATGLSEPFAIWGDPIPPGDWAERPEFVTYDSEGGGVFLDDVRVGTGDECPADIDGDGDTDLSDLAALLAAYRSVTGDPSFNPDADFDEDGDVDLSDLAFLLADYRCGTP